MPAYLHIYQTYAPNLVQYYGAANSIITDWIQKRFGQAETSYWQANIF